MKRSHSAAQEKESAFRAAALISIGLHVGLAILLTSNPGKPGKPRPLQKASVTISLDQFLRQSAPAAPAAVPQPAKPLPQEVSAATPAAKPRPPAPHEVARSPVPTPPKPAPAKPTSPAPPEEPPTDDLLGKIQDNWLRPPGVLSSFHCRLRIDYGAGGIILAVHLSQKCGGLVLDDSVTRAVWKSQPIPLPPHAASTGSIDVEFSP